MKKKIVTVLGTVAACYLVIATAVWAGDNGTLTIGGKIWLKKADCGGMMSLSSAGSYAGALASGACGLNDGSRAGQWRVPTIAELASLAGSTSGFVYLQSSSYYWSSTNSVMFPSKSAAIWKPSDASTVNIYSGKQNSHYVLFVR